MYIDKKISLSIGIPVYNVEYTIKDSIDSIVKQIDSELVGLCDLEILICDNCSTDSTKAIIGEYIDKYPNVNIRYHKNQFNLGASKNIRVVLENAKGEFVWLLGDDALFDKSLINLVEIIKRKHDDLGVVIVDSEIYDKFLINKKNLRDKNRDHYYNLFNNQKDFLTYAKESIYFLSSVIVKTQYYREISNTIDFNSYYPQTEVVLKLSKKYNSIVINNPLIKERDDSWISIFDADKKIDISFNMIDILIKNVNESILKKIPQYKISKFSVIHFINLFGGDAKNKSKILEGASKYKIFKKKPYFYWSISVLKILNVDFAYKILLIKCNGYKKNNSLKQKISSKVKLLLAYIISKISILLIIVSVSKLSMPIFDSLFIGNYIEDRGNLFFLLFIYLVSIVGFFLSEIFIKKCQK